jgi:predicted nucleotidyltransferase
MSSDLVSKIRDQAAPLLARHSVLAAYVYGSRISGRPREDSDLDIGYYLAGYRSGAALSLQQELAFEADLSTVLGLQVDLRNLAEAPLELRGRVLEDGARIFSGDDVERVGLERDTLSRYHDYKAEFAEMHAIRLRRIAEKGL